MQKILYYITVALALAGGALVGISLGSAIASNFNFIYLIVGASLLLMAFIISMISTLINYNPSGNQNRSRYNKNMTISLDELDDKLSLILDKNKFHLVKYGKEEVYQNGKGIFSTRKFLKIIKKEKSITIEGWISLGFKNKPNLEHPLVNDGSFAKSSKTIVLKTIDEILSEVY